jgi:hypothetical protein
MRKLCSSFLVLVLVWFCTFTLSVRSVAVAQVPILKNPDVLRMLESGLSTDVVVAKIKVSPVDFDTSPEALAELKKANVPEVVLLEMVRKSAPSADATEAKPSVEVNVPDGTEVEITLVNTASGEELKVGSIVDFTVNHDVVVDGVTVFKRDAPARAKITTAKKAGRWGRAGKLEWAMEHIQAADGNRVPARFTKRLVGDSKGGTVAIAAATTIFVGPLALLWGLKKGKPAIIPAGNRYSVFVHGDAKIAGKPAS